MWRKCENASPFEYKGFCLAENTDAKDGVNKRKKENGLAVLPKDIKLFKIIAHLLLNTFLNPFPCLSF
jgi:hypothetical protein